MNTVQLPAKFGSKQRRLFICVLGILVLGLAVNELTAQRIAKGGGGRGLPKIKEIDQEEGRRLIEAFRRQRLEGDFIFNIALEHHPYRGDKKHYQGFIMGTWNGQGPRNRMALWPQGAEDECEVELLVQGGRNPQVWKVASERQGVAVDTGAWMQPMLHDFIYTPFDVLMPFVYWNNFEYEGTKRVRSRPAHLFRMYPPDSFVAAYPEIHSVRLKLDARYNALLSAELLDNDEERLRLFNVVSFDKVNGQYIVKKIDLIDKVSRDKTRMQVVMAAVNVHIPSELLDAEQWAAGMPDLSGYLFERL